LAELSSKIKILNKYFRGRGERKKVFKFSERTNTHELNKIHLQYLRSPEIIIIFFNFHSNTSKKFKQIPLLDFDNIFKNTFVRFLVGFFEAGYDDHYFTKVNIL